MRAESRRVSSQDPKPRLLVELIRSERGRYAAAVAATCLSTIFLFVVPQVLRVTLDGLFTPDPRSEEELELVETALFERMR